MKALFPSTARPIAIACITWALVGVLRPLHAGTDRDAANVRSPHYVVGPINAEDLEQVPGTAWLIASGLASADHPANALSLVNTLDDHWLAAWPNKAGLGAAQPDRQRYATCSGLPDLQRFSPHGLALRREGYHTSTLYVVNDGPRAGVEIFRVDSSSTPPTITWIGCVEAPNGTHPNAVAPLPDGGFLMSSMMFGPLQDAVKDMVAGRATGEVFRWRANQSFEAVPGSRINGANGIAVSPDGKTLFVNAWSARRIERLPLQSGGMTRATLETNFLPDNVKWTRENRLAVTGQAVALPALIAEAAKPAKASLLPWTTAILDPAAMKILSSRTFAATESFGSGTTAIQVGDGLWVASFHADRIARWRIDR